MKMTKKIMSLAIVFAMVMAMSVTAFAQSVAATTPDADGATITINNAAKGETYTIYKVFDATVTGTENGSIAYTGDITGLETYFEKDGANNVLIKDNVEEAALFAALKTWTNGKTAVATAVSDGTVLTFTDLPYGYYVITSSQAEGAAITVDSTNPNASVYDKNSTEPGVGLSKTVDDAEVQIGDTVTYTVTFPTSNYDGADSTATKITSYTISDTLPDFLENVQVTSITIDNDPNSETDELVNVTEQFANKTIEIDWTNAQGAHLYQNGAVVTIVYTATVTADVLTEGTNTVTLKWTGETTGLTDEATISATYFNLQKTDANKQQLKGAEFKLYTKEADAENEGEFVYTEVKVIPVMKTVDEKQVVDYYRVAEADEVNSATTILVGSTTVKGLDAGVTYVLEETQAPNGYNMLTDYVDVTLGNETAIQVVNQTGTELPSTGGIGTTIFYALGGLMAVGAGVLLVAKKRMEA